MEKTSGKTKKWQHWLAVAAALVFVLGGTLVTRDDLAIKENGVNGAAAPAATAKYTTANTMSRSAVMDYAPASGVAMEETARFAEEKIIRNASFTLKTLDFDADLEKIQQLTADVSGRVEFLSTSGDKESGEMRHGSLTLRIPADCLDDFLQGAQSIGRLTALQQDIQDVSANYYDIQTRLDTQKTKMERLQKLLETAQDVSDLIEIENSIADTQYMIDSYTAQLNSYDDKVDYSTVHVTLREIQVQEAEEVSLGERVAAGLKQSLKSAGVFLRDCAVFLVAVSPWLLALAVVVIVIVIVRKKKGGKKK